MKFHEIHAHISWMPASSFLSPPDLLGSSLSTKTRCSTAWRHRDSPGLRRAWTGKLVSLQTSLVSVTPCGCSSSLCHARSSSRLSYQASLIQVRKSLQTCIRAAEGRLMLHFILHPSIILKSNLQDLVLNWTMSLSSGLPPTHALSVHIWLLPLKESVVLTKGPSADWAGSVGAFKGCHNWNTSHGFWNEFSPQDVQCALLNHGPCPLLSLPTTSEITD